MNNIYCVTKLVIKKLVTRSLIHGYCCFHLAFHILPAWRSRNVCNDTRVFACRVQAKLPRGLDGTSILVTSRCGLRGSDLTEQRLTLHTVRTRCTIVPSEEWEGNKGHLPERTLGLPDNPPPWPSLQNDNARIVLAGPRDEISCLPWTPNPTLPV